MVTLCNTIVATQALTKLFGEYVDGLNSESLRVSVWNGTVELDNLGIRPEALDKLELPFKVSGSIGKLRVNVPWTSLHRSPVQVDIQDVFLLVDKSVLTSRESARRAASAKQRALAAAAERQIRRYAGGLGSSEANWCLHRIGLLCDNCMLAVTCVSRTRFLERRGSRDSGESVSTSARLLRLALDNIKVRRISTKGGSWRNGADVVLLAWLARCLSRTCTSGMKMSPLVPGSPLPSVQPSSVFCCPRATIGVKPCSSIVLTPQLMRHRRDPCCCTRLPLFGVLECALLVTRKASLCLTYLCWQILGCADPHDSFPAHASVAASPGVY